ncbi:hypothetical protein APY03_7290 [Variovorax sp. WDL1]|nr:hypothetical protein APY03_7290 [Variovorax sp. WDL1]
MRGQSDVRPLRGGSARRNRCRRGGGGLGGIRGKRRRGRSRNGVNGHWRPSKNTM